MPKIPAITAKEMLRRLLAYGCEVLRVRGSHYRLRNPRNNRMSTIPVHNAEVKPGTYAAILRDLDISPQEFERVK